MHEVSIALAIVDEIEARLHGEAAEKVTAVHLRIGALTGVVPEALEFAWLCATERTLAAGSTLNIERVPLAIYCSKCACDRSIPDSVLPVCPVCGVSSNEIRHGRELTVTSMEVRYAAAGHGDPTQYTP